MQMRLDLEYFDEASCWQGQEPMCIGWPVHLKKMGVFQGWVEVASAAQMESTNFSMIAAPFHELLDE